MKRLSEAINQGYGQPANGLYSSTKEEQNKNVEHCLSILLSQLNYINTEQI